MCGSGNTNKFELGGSSLADGVTLDRRHAVRYKLRAAAEFRWDVTEGIGWTRDVSVSGAYVVCPIVPPLEKTIDIEVRFSRNSDIYPGLTIRSKGRVVRVESNPQSGFAVLAKLDRLARRPPSRLQARDEG